MSNEQVVVKSGGLSLSTILGIVFIVLKLTGNIDWSWWWVLSPFWIPFALVMAFLIIGLIIAMIK